MLGHYPGYIINLGLGKFILDELILLSSFLFTSAYFFKRKKISNRINGSGLIVLTFLLWISLTFLASFIRSENSLEILSRDRWILLNCGVLLMPLIYRPDIDDTMNFLRNLAYWIFSLGAVKLVAKVFVTEDLFLTQFGPGYVFMLSIALTVLLWFPGRGIVKLSASIFSLVLALLSEQLSSILMIMMAIILSLLWNERRSTADRFIFFI